MYKMYENTENFEYPKNFFYQSTTVFKAYGLWRPENYTRNMKSILIIKRFILFFWLGLFLYGSTYSGVPIYVEKGDTDRLADSLSYSTAIVTFQIKSFLLLLYEDRIKGFIKQLEMWTYEYRNSLDGVKNVRQALKQYAFIFWMGEIFFSFTIFTYCWYPVLSGEGRIIPMDTTLTFGTDMHKSPFYELFVTYEFVGIVSNTIMCMAFDMMFCGILAVTSAIFKNMNAAMKQDLGKIKNFPNDEEQKQKENHLKKYIEKYVEITQYIDRLQDTYTVPSLMHFVYNYIVMGVCMYQMSFLPIASVRFFSMLGGVLSVSVQLITYCHFGQEIEDQNTEFRSYLYTCDWYNQSIHFKKMILLSLRQSQETNHISAGKIMPLSRDTMKRILPLFSVFFSS